MKGDARKTRRNDARKKYVHNKKEKVLSKFKESCSKNIGEKIYNKLLFTFSTRRFFQIINNDKLIYRKSFRI